MASKKVRLYIVLTILLVSLIWPLIQSQLKPVVPVATSTLTPTPTVAAILGVQVGQRTKFNNCLVRGPLPDPDCTPGDTFKNVTADQICVPGYSKSVRNVSSKVKNAVYAEYGIYTHVTGEYEVDHLIPLELGGSNDIANLWPEAANPLPGCHQKDKVENYLHQQVCLGNMSLEAAQSIIANDWLSTYNSINN